MFKALPFFIFVHLACAAPLLLVQSITSETTGIQNYSLKPTDNQYKLVINYGNGFRVETVEEVAPGELVVKGQHDQFFDNHGNLVTTYEAGPNGYIAKFKYEWIPAVGLPANVLKSTAG